MKTWSMAISISCALAACGSSQGTHPNDMSVAEHEATSGREQAASVGHARQYEPKAEREDLHCASSYSTGSYTGSAVCWTSISNPTAQHREDAQEHGELAEKHRAAAQALRDAEARACADVSQQDRDTSPFYHREDIVQVTTLDQTRERNAPAGARIVFRAVPGLTVEGLQHLVNCHLARAASVGYALPEMAYCPLALKDVHAIVSSAGDGFAVAVTSADFDTALEIQRRAALVQTRAAQ